MKNYVLTGSIGHITKPIAEALIKDGHNVSIVTSNPENEAKIKSLGATPLVGSVEDKNFVKKAFAGADVVYTMIPPIWATSDWRASQLEIAKAYADAIVSNGIKYVVNLSSVGAHLSEGVGPVTAIHDFEEILNGISGLNVRHLRPAFFYYNFLNYLSLIKQAGIIAANYGGGDQKLAMVHTDDIAAAAVEELKGLSFKGNSVRSIVSDIRGTNDIVRLLGDAIGKKVSWVEVTDEEQLNGMLGSGMPATHAPMYVEMGHAVRSGKMLELVINKPATGKIKLEDYASEFAKAYK